MEQILLLVFKTFLFVSEISFELWRRQNKKAFDAEIIKRLEAFENQVNEVKFLAYSVRGLQFSHS